MDLHCWNLAKLRFNENAPHHKHRCPPSHCATLDSNPCGYVLYTHQTHRSYWRPPPPPPPPTRSMCADWHYHHHHHSSRYNIPHGHKHGRSSCSSSSIPLVVVVVMVVVIEFTLCPRQQGTSIHPCSSCLAASCLPSCKPPWRGLSRQHHHSGLTPTTTTSTSGPHQ